MCDVNRLAEQIDQCPLGNTGWRAFEDLCTEVLEYLFVPPLSRPRRQARTYSGINRRDAVFPNRNIVATTELGSRNWYHLYVELSARMILFEFKNYDATDIGHEEVNQTRSYLTRPMGQLGIMICSKPPVDGAFRQRNTIYTNDQKVILFMTNAHLKEMLFMSCQGKSETLGLDIDL